MFIDSISLSMVVKGKKMIIYEVTVTIKLELKVKYETFMRQRHIPDLMKTGYFVGAEFAQMTEGRYRVRYLTKDRETLERYLETEAQNLRADFIKHFPVGVEVTREILEVLQTFKMELK